MQTSVLILLIVRRHDSFFPPLTCRLTKSSDSVPTAAGTPQSQHSVLLFYPFARFRISVAAASRGSPLMVDGFFPLFADPHRSPVFIFFSPGDRLESQSRFAAPAQDLDGPPRLQLSFFFPRRHFLVPFFAPTKNL